MSDILNTSYITIKKTGVFVAGKSARYYRRKEIAFINVIKERFVNLQEENPEIEELHVGAFETKGKYAQPGNPSGKYGRNAWCRVKLFDGRLGPWVFFIPYISASDCAGYCAYHCGNRVRDGSAMRSAVLYFTGKGESDTQTDKAESDLKQILEKIDFSKYVEKKVELNGYRITIEKIIQKTK